MSIFKKKMIAKLVLMLSILMALITIISILYFSYVKKHELAKKLEETVTYASKFGELGFGSTLWNINTVACGELAKAILAGPEIVAINVFDDKGNLFVGFEKDLKTFKLKEEPITSAFKIPEGNKYIFEKSGEIKFENNTVGKYQLFYTNIFNVEEIRKENIKIVIEFLLIAMIIIITLFIFIRKSVIKPITEMKEMIKVLSEGEGDLTKKITVDSQDEIGEMGTYFNNFIDKLSYIILKIKEGAYNIDNEMKDIKENINEEVTEVRNLSVNIEESNKSLKNIINLIKEIDDNINYQSSSVEEVSATIAEMSASLGNMSENIDNVAQAIENTSQTVAETVSLIEKVVKTAEKTNTISDQALKYSEDGIQAVHSSLNGMEQIKEQVDKTASVLDELSVSVKNISNILSVINDIAEQTNLLSLNAAIEAARAGDAGRGFAVVADEVRKLSDKTAKATKEIQHMIIEMQNKSHNAVNSMQQAIKNVNEGSNQVYNMKQVLENIKTGANSTNINLVEVVAAVQEQKMFMDDIMHAISEIKTLATELKSGAKENAHGSEEISKTIITISNSMQEIKKHSSEELIGANEISEVIENIESFARKLYNFTEETANNVKSVANEVTGLNAIINKFIIEENKKGIREI